MTAQGPIPSLRAFPRDLRDAAWTAARSGDRDRYWAALFVPEPARTGLMALAAFNAELARIPEIVSEPLLGEMRLQWWRDALASDEPTGHAAADAVRYAAKAFALDGNRLLGLIDARIFDVTGDVMPDMQATGAYLQKTAGSMFALAAQITGDEDSLPRDIVSDAAIAYGLTGLMRALAIDRARGRLHLPQTLFEDRGATLDDVFKGGNPQAIGAALADGRVLAGEALENARKVLPSIEPRYRLAFLPLALVAPSLKALSRAGAQALETPQHVPPLTRLWHLTRVAFVGQV